jgi:hypothetical protein
MQAIQAISNWVEGAAQAFVDFRRQLLNQDENLGLALPPLPDDIPHQDLMAYFQQLPHPNRFRTDAPYAFEFRFRGEDLDHVWDYLVRSAATLRDVDLELLLVSLLNWENDPDLLNTMRRAAQVVLWERKLAYHHFSSWSIKRKVSQAVGCVMAQCLLNLKYKYAMAKAQTGIIFYEIFVVNKVDQASSSFESDVADEVYEHYRRGNEWLPHMVQDMLHV